MDKRWPSKSESVFLSLAYNRFYDLFDEVMDDRFWEQDEWRRFSKIVAAFSIYGEILSYEPIKSTIEAVKTARPPIEAEIGSQFFKFVRNVLAHFPFFEKWDDVWISRELVNWSKPNQSIDKFLVKYTGKSPIKYRFWEADKRRMTYVAINFPIHYEEEERIYLRDIISEKDGVRFCFLMMKQIMKVQIDSIEDQR